MLQLPPPGQLHYSVAFSLDGRWLAAGGLGSAIDLWDLHAPSQPSRRFGPFPGPVVRVQFTPVERLVVVTTEQALAFALATGAVHLQVGIPYAGRAVCSLDGQNVQHAAAGHAGTLVWDADD